MKKYLSSVLAAVFSACLLTPAAVVAGFAKYVQITLDGYTGNQVDDFPVLIKIDESKLPGVYTDVKNAGADLKFTDSTGTVEYPYEVDVWNSSGTSLVWVKVPSLTSSTAIRMYYGDAEKTSNPGSAQVWSGYHGVWHLNAGLADSVADGTPAVAVSPTTMIDAGAIGSGCKISSESVTSGSKTGAVYCPGTASVDYSSGCTVSVWMNNVSYSQTWNDQMLVATCSQTWEKKGGFCIRANTWPNSGKEMMFSNGNCNFKLQNSSAPSLWDNNVWHLLSLVWNGSTMTVYIDGVAGSSWSGEITNSGEPLTFGNGSNLDSAKIGTEESACYSWKGGVDECRFTTAIKSADWLRAEYLVATTQNLLTFGTPQELTDYQVSFSAEDETVGRAPFSVTFTASAVGFSGAVTYKWDFDNDGTVDLATTDATITHTFARGVFSVKVTAEDDELHSASTFIDDYVRVSGEMYVDANAEVEGDGTMASPFKTLTNAVANAIDNEMIYLRGGAERTYAINRCDDAVVIGANQIGLTIQGCGADWTLPSGWGDTDNLAAIGLSDKYAEDSKTLTASTSFNAPFEVLAENCTISGIKCEYGKLSFKAQNQGGKGFVNVSANSFTLKNSYLKMKVASGQYDSAGCNGLLCGMTSDATNMRAVGCYIEMGYFRTGLVPIYNGYSGSGLIQCFVKNTAAAFGSGAQTQADLYFASNTFYNCKNEDSGYTCWLFDCGANSYPGGGEIAYNLAIHDDGTANRYRFMQHGRQYAGSWNKEVSIHHNTIVGYDVVFETPHNSNEQRNNTWQPLIFSNLILCPQGTNIVENVAAFNAGVAQTWTYRESNKDIEITTSYRPGSEYRCNALLADTFLAGEALTLIPGYDITEGLSYTNTTINLTTAPTFLNTADPASPDFYRMKGVKGDWFVSGGHTYDGAYPAYIGALMPQVQSSSSGLLIIVR